MLIYRKYYELDRLALLVNNISFITSVSRAKLKTQTSDTKHVLPNCNWDKGMQIQPNSIIFLKL